MQRVQKSISVQLLKTTLVNSVDSWLTCRSIVAGNQSDGDDVLEVSRLVPDPLAARSTTPYYFTIDRESNSEMSGIKATIPVRVALWAPTLLLAKRTTPSKEQEPETRETI